MDSSGCSLPRDRDGRQYRCLLARERAPAATASVRPTKELVMVALREPLKTGTRPFALREYRELSRHADDVGMFLARTFFLVSQSSARNQGRNVSDAH
jgi:hypothetical protein